MTKIRTRFARSLAMRILGPSLAVIVSLWAAGPSRAQSAVPPSDSALDAANLKTEWTIAIPVLGKQDGVSLIQVTDNNQIFVRTKAGLLVVLDAKTGGTQWSFKFDSVNAPVYPVAVNDRHVVAVNLVTLYCFHRYSGLVEFEYRLPLVPSSAPSLDRDVAYVTMNGQRVTAYELPQAIQMPEKRANPNAAGGFGSLAGAVDNRIRNPADIVSTRYPGSSRKVGVRGESFEEQKVTIDARTQSTGGALATQRSPSLSVAPSVRPPYKVFDDKGKYITRSESLSTVHSLRQPYSLQDPTGAQIQRTPSVSAIPPSLAAVYELASLLPRAIEPKARWVVGSTVRLTYAPLATNFRIWMIGDSPFVQAYLKDDRGQQILAKLPNAPAAQPAQAEDIGYFPLADGNLLAIDLSGGGGAVAKVNWRSNVGGAMNREPLVTKDSVYQGGDTSGVARVDRATGDVTWRTDDTADTVLAVNDETVYTRDKQGVLRAYDRNRVVDTASKRAVLLGSVNLAGFPNATMNDRTDRIYVASETGLLICLRDKARKYTAALPVGLPVHKPEAVPAKKPADPAAPK
jgi:outer membrane protein assembly factor BamB